MARKHMLRDHHYAVDVICPRREETAILNLCDRGRVTSSSTATYPILVLSN